MNGQASQDQDKCKNVILRLKEYFPHICNEGNGLMKA